MAWGLQFATVLDPDGNEFSWRSAGRLTVVPDHLRAGVYKITLATKQPGYVTAVLRFVEPNLAPLFVPLDPNSRCVYEKVVAISHDARIAEILIEPRSSAEGTIALNIERLGSMQLLATGWRKAIRQARSPQTLFKKAWTVVRGGSDIVFSSQQASYRSTDEDYRAWQQAFEGPTETARVLRRLEDLRGRRHPRVMCVCSSGIPTLGSALLTFDTLASDLPSGGTQLVVFDEGSIPGPLRTAIEERQGRIIRRAANETWKLLAREIERFSADLVLFLERPGYFHPTAIPSFHSEFLAYPSAMAVYGDHDWMNSQRGRHSPFFKPDWSPEYARAWNYVGPALAFRADPSFFDRLGSGDTFIHMSYEVLLRLTSTPVKPESVRHVPKVLYHLNDLVDGSADGKRFASLEQELATVVLPEIEGDVKVEPLPINRACAVRHVGYQLPTPIPLVSVIVPSKDNAALLQRAVQSALDADYANTEVIVVDNGSTRHDQRLTLESLSRDPRVHVVYDPSAFNFSRLINAGSRTGRGQILLLLNDDVEAIDKRWLSELTMLAGRPGIGCVGALLLYPDHSIQHAGVVLGINGTAGHAFRHRPLTAPELGHRLEVPHEVSAVTGACLAVKADLFADVGGFDEGFPVTMNDIDFCLRVAERGYRNLFTPHARLLHRESTTRGLDTTPDRLQRLARERSALFDRWGSTLLEDTYYNPHLTRSHEDFRPRGV